MKILLTRSKNANESLRRELIDKLPQNSAQIHSINLVELSDVDFDFSKLTAYRNIIVTSKHVASRIVDNLDKLGNWDQRPASNFWIVGKLSAKILQEQIDIINSSFKISHFKIEYVANSARELVETLGSKESYAYLAGNVITMEMPGFVDKYEIYSSSYKSSFYTEEIHVLKNNIDLIAVYSENCAKTLTKLLDSSDLTKYVENTTKSPSSTVICS